MNGLHYRVVLSFQMDTCHDAICGSMEEQEEREENDEQEKEEEEIESDSDDNTLSHQHVSSYHTTENDGGRLLCWGNGEFGQTGRGRTSDISCQRGLLEQFATSKHGARVKIIACGSSHTVVVTRKLTLLSRHDSIGWRSLVNRQWL